MSTPQPKECAFSLFKGGNPAGHPFERGFARRAKRRVASGDKVSICGEYGPNSVAHYGADAALMFAANLKSLSRILKERPGLLLRYPRPPEGKTERDRQR